MKTLLIAVIFKTILNITALNANIILLLKIAFPNSSPDAFVPHVCLSQLVFSHPFMSELPLLILRTPSHLLPWPTGQ